jgi:hypothetical protein
MVERSPLAGASPSPDSFPIIGAFLLDQQINISKINR